MSASVYIHKKGQELGPFPEERIQDMITSGMISADDLYWIEGNPDWQPIRTRFPTATRPPTPLALKSSAPSTVALTDAHPGFWLRFAAHFIDIILANIAAFIGGFFIGVGMAVSGITDEEILGAIGYLV